MKKIVIFGASGGAIKVAQTFKNLNIDFEYFVDNDSKKWGDFIEEKCVKSPDELLKNDYYIVIASIYQEEIEKQLKDMGIQLERILPKEKWILQYIDLKLENFQQYIEKQKIVINNEIMFYLDLAEGMQVGGIESWCYNVANLLKNTSDRCKLISKITNDNPPDDLKDNVLQMDIRYDDYIGSVKRIMDEMLSNLPCVMVANWMTQNFVAAVILKKLYPDKVYLIAGLHHDMLAYYRRNKYIENYVDGFLCVSSGIYRRMIDEFHVSPEKVYFSPVPLKVTKNIEISVCDVTKPIKIGFAARLVKAQKRADYIIPLIEKLEELAVNYQFEIAGTGKYYNIIADYVSEHNISKVKLYGEIKYEGMQQFWSGKDIVVSVSDQEGMGLSILEAMSFGIVPVVTDTAGIRDFVIDGENGYVVNLGDIEEIAQRISFLDKNRNKLIHLKKYSRDIIKEKCSAEEYCKLIYKMISG